MSDSYRGPTSIFENLSRIKTRPRCFSRFDTIHLFPIYIRFRIRALNDSAGYIKESPFILKQLFEKYFSFG